MKTKVSSVKKNSASLETVACVVLAAGKGTRMRSSKAKVLHTLLGAPLVAYPIERAREVGADPVVAVLGHQSVDVEAALVSRYGPGAVTVVEQTEQKGTGHAVKVGLEPLAEWQGLVLVLYGDAPLLRRETIAALLAEARRTGGLAILTAVLPDPTGYGRIIRDARKKVKRVVEEKDTSKTERKIREINAGFYAAPAAFLRKATASLKPNNRQGEYYMTDVVEIAARTAGVGVTTVEVTPEEMAGINDRRQLIDAEGVMRRRTLARFAEQVTFRDADSTVIEPGVEIGADVEIGRNVSLRGRTRIAEGVRIDDGVILSDTEVGAGAEIKAYTVASEAIIGPGAKVGPFAHLRPGTDLGPDVHVGNFVETKKARLGRGSKANHLSYLGDAQIGEKVNVGAGTITCNYNGYEKRQTVIEDGAFIGSDSQLVAPVRVGRRAVVAAGATITRDVPEGALAITRPEQKHVDGYADRVAERYGKKPAAARPAASEPPPAANGATSEPAAEAPAGAVTGPVTGPVDSSD
jgi:bifunctional UDP-N-acetylglucosamine pyrophosphorylase / glucosamine-1-phosphate N-acetyltransferase